MRKPLIAGNWKMFKTAREAREFAEGLKERLLENSGAEVLVCPPFTALAAVADVFKGTAFALGAQNMFWEKEGAFTGEISPRMLVDAGCGYVLLGHSERRQLFGETDEAVHQKILAALEYGLKPILCVGETLSEREKGQAGTKVAGQLKAALSGLTAAQMEKVVIAYEPIWAIGTGKTASAADAQEMSAHIRKVAGGAAQVSDKMRVLYGGSVKPDNIKELMAQPDVDGVLVGGASLQVTSFTAIARYDQ